MLSIILLRTDETVSRHAPIRDTEQTFAPMGKASL
jgi:hypothetical protein